MIHRKLLTSALALAMMAAMLLSPALPTAKAAPPGTQNAPQAAPEAPDVLNTNRDEFSIQAYTNNNGTQSWAANWTETGDNSSATSGTIQITTGGELRFGGTGATGDTLYRPVNANMASALYATLSFEYRTSNTLDYSDELAVEISTDGGTTYTTLEIFHEDNTGSRIYGINEFISAATVIRFRINANLTASGDYYFLDNVQVSYDTAAQKIYQDVGWEGGILGNNNNRTGQTCSEPSVHYFTIHDRFTVTDLNVGINATHVDRGDVRVTVNSPANTTSIIVASNNTDGDQNYDILVDDASAAAIDDDSDDNIDEAYYDRTVGPSTNGLLDVFNGENAEGVWKVVVCDAHIDTSTRDGMSNHVTLFFTGTDLPAQAPPTGETSGPVVHTYYTPFPEDQVKLMQDTVFPHDGPSVPTACANNNNTSQTFNTNPKDPVITRNGISVLYDDTVIYYDHYEDGYEVDLATRNQQSTEHWGDGDMTNGVAPLAGGQFDADDVLQRGQVVVTADVVQTQFLGTYFEYDARDKIGATFPVAMTHLTWAAGSSTLFAGALEMYPLNRWGLNFELPVGEDDNVSDMFEYTGVSVMASEDGTTVNIDSDDNGSTDITCNLDEGESCQVNGGMNTGATISADEPIQVALLTADECAFFEARMFALIPRDQWDDSYFVPVGTKQAGSGNINDDVPTYAHVYNPNPFSITVDWETQGPAAQTQFTVAAGDRVNQTIPYGSGAHFFSLSGSAQGNVRDEFSIQAYTNNDGSDPWATAWDETGDDDLATSGDIWVNDTTDRLEFRNSPAAGLIIQRSVNLSTATSATFSYSWLETAGSTTGNDTMVVEVREGGAGGWTELERIEGNDGSGTSSHNISTFTTNPTEIRFRLEDALESGETVSFDNVNIAFTEPGSGGDPPDFNVVFTVDSDPASGTDPDRNDTTDWGDSAIPESQMTGLLLSSIGNGYDPEYVGTALNNSSPLYVTAWNSGNPELTTDVCFDYNADGDGPASGGGTDPGTGYEYDERFTITDLDSFVVYDNSDGDNNPDTNDLDQSGMFVFVCNGTSGIITANWGQDPDRAFPGRPAIDVGTGIPNLVPFTIGKVAQLALDLNGNGLYDPGDTVEYEITINNAGANDIPANTLVTTDEVPDNTTYVPGTTEYEQPNATVLVIPDGAGSTLPLSVLNGGFTYPHVLPIGDSFKIRFQVTINVPFPDDTDEITNIVQVTDGVFTLKAEAVVPVQEPVLGAIGNYVWFDEDGDGDQDAGEAGIPNVQVDLYQDTGAGYVLVATTYTDVNGGYLFPGLDAGDYRVDVVSTTLPDPDGGGPGGLHHTYDEDDGTGPFATPHSTLVSLGSGEEHLTADFGYNWAPPTDTNNPPLNALGAIGDRVWVDSDGDGVQDAGEAGIPGVTVELWYDSDGDGVIDAQFGTTTTNGAGNYIFDQLPPGIYVVRIPTPPAGYTQTGDPDYFGQLLPPAARDNQTTTPIVLGPGDVFLNADFGYQPPEAQDNSIGDKVWFDADADGVGPAGAPGGTDTDEYGIPGVTVALISDLNNDGIWDLGEPIVATTVTDADGDYLFSGLADGSYLVWVNDTDNVLGEVTPTYDSNAGAVPTSASAPTGVHSNTVLGISSVINLGVGNPSPASDLAQDFGYTAAGQTPGNGAIGDTVFLDANNDGNFDQGEGLEGVVVALYDNQGNKIAQTTTDENGHYYFGGLATSEIGVTYVVQIQNNTLPNGGVGLLNHVDPDDPSPGDSFSTVTLTVAAPINLDQDFGYRPAADPGSIGNYIWEDSNADGVNNEPAGNGIDGVTVDLYEDSNNNGVIDSGDHLVGQTMTAPDGSYLFTQLPSGNYLVDVTDDAGVLNGYWHSLGAAGVNDNSQQDPHAVTLAAGQNYVAADFGYYVDPAAVGNRIWLDANSNGVQDGGEAGINGVEVRMTVTYPNGDVTVLTTVTGPDPVSGAPGWYSFGNLLQDEDYNGAGTYGADPTYTVSVDTTQPALAGLAPSPTGQGTPTTDSNNPAGTPTAPVQGQTNTLFSNDPATIASYDFGFTPLLGSIGNYIWVDENSDGYQDAGEPGIANVTVNLYNSAGALVATTVTDAQGGYLFDNLPAGSYYVDVVEATLPIPGMTQTPYNLPGADFGNQDHSTTPIPSTALTGYPVTLAAGGENLTADFGYNYNPSPDVNGNTGPAALGDRVWIDADGDGFQDPEEAGIGGVPVQIFTAGPDGVFGTPDDAPGIVTLTDYNGNYLFDNLAPGAYVVKVITPPAGYTQTGDPDHFGTSGGVNDNQTTTPVILGPGDVFLNADFGYQPPASQNNSIGNKVWFDADADGVGPNGNGLPGDDNNEPGIPGVTVALINDLDGDGVWDPNEPIIATDVTNASGDYLFPGLPDGNYLVWVNDTDNVLGEMRPTYDVNGGLPYLGAGAPTGLASGTVLGLSASALDPTGANASPVDDLAQDFGYTALTQTPVTGLIGDRVWLDIDSDGVQDANEPGLESVMVTLLDVNGNELGATFTDENGNYYFGGLPAGTYTVQVSPPAGLSQTYDADGLGTAHQSTVTIGPGGINLLQDFGYVGTGEIGNLVWEDLNADGNVDSGESGIGGVTIDLYWDLNGNGRVDPGEPLVGSTVTAPDGSYLFDGLPVDDGGGNAQFVVDVTDEAGVLGGYWHSLGTPGADDNSQADPYPVTLTTSAPSNVTADFGYYVQPAALGNFVWLDDLPGSNATDGNGIQDPGEPGIANVEVTLTITWPDNTTTVVKTVTDATGWYSFGNLLLDEDYNGDGSGPEPVHVISIDLTQTALSGLYVTEINATGSTPHNDSNDPDGATAQPVQGQTNTSFANDSVDIASFDFGFSTTPLAVLLASFAATAQPDHVLVAWETVSEIDNAGFNLYRSLSADGERTLLAALPSAAPGSTQGAAYSVQDADVLSGQTYWYFLEDIDLSGAATLHGPVSVLFQAPTAVTLSAISAASPAPLDPAWLAAVAGLAAASGAALRLRRRSRQR